jgi:heme/copper-type cytochrome/quinol oxidase subunit 2
VKSDNAEKTVTLTANVNKAGGIDALMISVIVLAIVLVILVVVLVKTRKSSDEMAEAEESYY